MRQALKEAEAGADKARRICEAQEEVLPSSEGNSTKAIEK